MEHSMMKIVHPLPDVRSNHSFDRERESISSGSLKLDPAGKKRRPKSGHLGSIKPPLIQRPEGAPITMKGWLFKQGSDGLMLWKKRWFVLSEFCLFYYKGPEEGKVLGSILLPSYKISPCSGEEKFFRKFAFKIEHVNMRTYYFAAENKDSMTLWMNALSLASIMHSKEGKIDEAITSNGGDELDGGFRSTLQRRPKSMDAGRTLNRASWGDRNSAATTSPLPDHRLDNSYDSELSPAPPGRGPRQPLYANAPPKPKRIVDWENGQIGPDYAYGPIPGMGNGGVGVPAAGGVPAPAYPNHVNPADRRTPEAYARSRLADYDSSAAVVNGLGLVPNGRSRTATTPISGTATMPPPSSSTNGGGGARRQSPYASATIVPHNNNNNNRYGIGHSHASSPFAPPPSRHQHQAAPVYGYPAGSPLQQQNHVGRHHPQQQPQYVPPPRPHSADFLDYEPSPPPPPSAASHQHRSRYVQHQQRQLQLQQRPKSSIDTAPPPPHSGGDYWSEEAAYAEKMRVQQASAASLHRPPSVKPPSSLPLKNVLSASPAPPNGGVHPNYSSQTFPSRGAATAAAAAAAVANGRDHSAPNTNRSYSPVDFGPNGFLRSASARLPRHKQPRDQELQSAASASYLDDSETDGLKSVDRKKLQQREESMKRLLEWKQRMLQSPLTRKAHSPKPESPKLGQSANSNGGGSDKYRRQVLQELAHQHQGRGGGPDDVRQQQHQIVNGGGGGGSGSSSSGPPSSSSSSFQPPSAAAQTVPSSSGGGSHRQQRPTSLEVTPLAGEPNHRKTQSRVKGDGMAAPGVGDPQQRWSTGSKPHGHRNQAYASFSSDDDESSSSTMAKSNGSVMQSLQQHQQQQQQQQQQHTTKSEIEELFPKMRPTVRTPSVPNGGPERYYAGQQPQPQSWQQQNPAGVANSRPQSVPPGYQHQPRMPGFVGGIRPPAPPSAAAAVNKVHPAPFHHQQPRGFVPPPPPPLAASSSSSFQHRQQQQAQPTAAVPNGGASSSAAAATSAAVNRGLANLARTPSPYTAGDLLGKSHEELVLLLLNLRREGAAVVRGMKQTRADMEAQLGLMNGPRSGDAVRMYEDLSCRLRDLEKRFEAQKPVLHLVSNMVKLGSLYDNADNANFSAQVARERIEFQRRVQERRAASTERPSAAAAAAGTWDDRSPDHKELEGIISRVYRMDDFLHAEAMSVCALREDKNLLEGALNNVRQKLKGEPASGDPQNTGSVGLTATEVEKLKRHQHLLEQELAFVKNHLSTSSAKLEDAESENMRLEHELVVLRQKVLVALKHATSLQAHNLANQELEAELVKVQQLTKDLQRRRMDLSHQVKTITERSFSSSHLNQLAAQEQLRPSPTGVVGAGAIPMKKKQPSSWYETDLDSMTTVDCGREPPYNSNPYTHVRRSSAGSGFPPYPNGPVGYDQYTNGGGWGFGARGRPYSSSQESLTTYQQYRQHGGAVGPGGNGQPQLGAAPWGKHSSVGNMVAEQQQQQHHQARMMMMMGGGGGGGYQQYQHPPPPPAPSASDDAAFYDFGDNGDDRMKQYQGIPTKERSLEIKTVRSVKRESQQRQKDRGRRQTPEPVLPGSTLAAGAMIGGGGSPGGDISSMCHSITSAVWAGSDGRGGVGDEELSKEERELLSELEHPETVLETDPVLSQFHRSMSLPRNYDRNNRSSNWHEMKSMYGYAGGQQGQQQQPGQQQQQQQRQSLQPGSQMLRRTEINSQRLIVETESFEEQLVRRRREMARHLRHTPRPKLRRKHHTVSSSQPVTLEDTALSPRKRNSGAAGKSADDLDMERALRSPHNRLSTPDVVRSTINKKKELRYNEETIDTILGKPKKINIPERYVPEDTELSESEKAARQKKAEAIKKMLLSETQITAELSAAETAAAASVSASDKRDSVSASDVSFGGLGNESVYSSGGGGADQVPPALIKAKVEAEKRRREHMLALNQALAKEVIERTKIVAARRMSNPSPCASSSDDDQDGSSS